MKKIILLVVGLVIFVVGLVIYLKSKPQPHTIVLAENGFVPQELTIKQGETVTFSTTLGKPFWPASNLHPTHDIYPEFDPKKPIESDASWSFKFTRVGKWMFHDHLFPSFRGEITVEDALRSQKSQGCQSEQACWQEMLINTTKEQGIGEAFKLVEKLFNQEPNFAADCHDYMHSLGDAAYEVFANTNRLVLPDSASYCAYGFYHGFMNALVRYSGDLSKAAAFCNSQTTIKSQWSCYHGIGHGLVSDQGQLSSSVDQYIAPGLEVCEYISEDIHIKGICASGVFNALAIELMKNNFSPNETKPYAYCALLDKTYFKKACYEEMNTFVNSIGKSLWDSASKVTDIPDRHFSQLAIQSLAGVWSQSRMSPASWGEVLAVCQRLPADIHDYCIRGFGMGLQEHGAPGREYEQSLSFCNYSALTARERNFCYDALLYFFKVSYTPEQMQGICKLVRSDYRASCLSG